VNKNKFTDNQRIQLKKDFKSIFELGRKLKTTDIAIWYKTSSLTDVRLGIIASKKLGNAVIRNRIKRLIREVFRLNRHRIKTGTDIIVYPQKAANFVDFSTASDIVLSILKKAGVFKDD
jgi:ribonuclease P protein component